MAVVLSYDCQLVQPAPMSSFVDEDNIQQTQSLASSAYLNSLNDIDRASCDTDNGVHLNGLDGTNDRSIDNPFTRSKTNSRRPDTAVTSSHPQPSTRTAKPLPLATQNLHKVSFCDVHHNSTPRKRRRINSVLDQSEVQEKSARIDANSTAWAQNFQPEVEIFGADDNIQETRNATPTSPENELHSSKGIASKTKGRASSKSQVTSQHSPSGSPEHLTSTEPVTASTPSKGRRGRPVKKTLSLHTNGKLLSSPATESKQSVKESSAEKHQAVSKRNYKMRNGKFVQTLEVVLHYGKNTQDRQEIGTRIDAVLSQSKTTAQSDNGSGGSKTHPFFLGKIKGKHRADAVEVGTAENTDKESDSRKQEPVAWKDIKFSSLRLAVTKHLDSAPSPWPPLTLQHVGVELPIIHSSTRRADGSSKAKLKARLVELRDDENVLKQYSQVIKKAMPLAQAVKTPRRLYISGAEAATDLHLDSVITSMHDAISSVRSAITHGLSAFDRGECAGPHMWTSQYAPQQWSEVLQPSASVLHQWLRGLAIHNVKSGVDAGLPARKHKLLTKKKRRKVKQELDDFIVDSDEEDGTEKARKNAILIVGPNGCGKTASVFAVAKELGFEVFEIHPGVRRTAKDIFDKVGDMAHNHLVQNGADPSRSSSAAPSGADTDVDTDTDIKQTSVVKFLSAKHKLQAGQTELPKPNQSKKEQKQSLILFEEVDQLFEDDKGFWSGVQSLIKHSKRPVVLTCNDASSVPVEDLDLYDILTYGAVEPEIATDYLVCLAAAEGHILDREAVSTLYELKRSDLRASITQLNFWCQMTVGSRYGGLDWMVQTLPGQSKFDHYNNRLRIFSKGTFQKSLDLMPQIMTEDESAILFAQDSLGIAASEWCDYAGSKTLMNVESSASNLQILSQLADITDARSVIDLLDNTAAPSLATATAAFSCNNIFASGRDVVSLHYERQLGERPPRTRALLDVLLPIMTEKPTFPPSLGRLAPSIDTSTSSVATDIAPYVRSIVNFDQRLERHRDEMFGSQGKARKTRAARAAAEGGDKASTRSERWFPKGLDFDEVMRTGSSWPRWYEGEQMVPAIAAPSTPSATSDP